MKPMLILLLIFCLTGCETLKSKQKKAPTFAIISDSNSAVESMPPQSLAGSQNEPARGGATRAVAIDSLETSNLGIQQINAKILQDRMIVYTGTISLSVANREAARTQIETLVQNAGGYIVRASLTEIVFRVKPEAFKSTMNDLSALGTVLERTMNSDDVTDQYSDTKLRLEVAEGSRKRLMDLLSKAKDNKDVLEIERDIRRLTEEIERMKGQMRLLENQVALSTITVSLRETVPPPRKVAPRPPSSQFGWLNRIGIQQAFENVSPDAPLKGGSLWRWVKWKTGFAPFELKTGGRGLLPSRFVPLEYSYNDLIGATAAGNRLRVMRLKLRQRGELGFWAEALEQELIKSRGYIGKSPAPATLNQRSLKGVRLSTQTSQEGNPYDYDVWLIQKPNELDELFVVDYIRNSNAPEKEKTEVEQAVQGIRID